MFTSSEIKNKSTYIVLILFIFILDQATKIFIMNTMYYGEVTTVIDGFFYVVYYLNKGAAFGIFSSWGMGGKIMLSLTSIIAFVILLYLLLKTKDDEKLAAFTYALIAGGAVGNLYDRALREGVVDFLEFCLGGRCWPAFNVADSCITVGVCVLAWILFKEGKDEFKKTPPAADN